MQVPPLEGVTEEKTGLLLSRPKRFFLLVANIGSFVLHLLLGFCWDEVAITCLLSFLLVQK